MNEIQSGIKLESHLDEQPIGEAIAVVCVLKSGGTVPRNYRPRHVEILRNAVRRNLSPDIRYHFVCLSDINPELDGVNWIPLAETWSGCWSKINLYKHGLFDDISREVGEEINRILFFDLDLVICGNIDGFARYDGEVAFELQYVPVEPRLSTSIMSISRAWHDIKAEEIFWHFSTHSEIMMQTHEKTGRDESYLRQFVNGYCHYWQHLCEGQLISWDKHYRNSGGQIPDSVRIINFGGAIKPEQYLTKQFPLTGQEFIEKHYR